MRIYLVGFMGSGKSTFGRELASRLGFSFYDLDSIFEDSRGTTIARFIEGNGEDKFRELESALLRGYDWGKNIVIAAGGGTPCFHDNMNYMKQTGQVIYLELSEEVLFRRLVSLKEERPLLKEAKNEVELRALIHSLLSKREKIYRQAHIICAGEALQASEVINRLHLR